MSLRDAVRRSLRLADVPSPLTAPAPYEATRPVPLGVRQWCPACDVRSAEPVCWVCGHPYPPP